jgi:hypothetical protein
MRRFRSLNAEDRKSNVVRGSTFATVALKVGTVGRPNNKCGARGRLGIVAGRVKLVALRIRLA